MSPDPVRAARSGAAGSIMPQPAPRLGVRIIGTGRAVPSGTLTNHDLARFMDTTDEWIVQRTGIHTRWVCDPSKGESTTTLSTRALSAAIADARIEPRELDMVIVASVTGEMLCPSTACRVAAEVGASRAGAFDVLAACSGWVYSANMAHSLIRSGQARTVAVVGCDVMSSVMDYENRGVVILFGDAAGAAIFRATDDVSRGMIAGSFHADGSRWCDLYLPRSEFDVPAGADRAIVRANSLQMNGREVYKFAVGTFSGLIGDTLEHAGLQPGDVDMYICHQSNARMLESARDRFKIPPERFYINIDRYGNCSAGSVPVCLDEVRRAGGCPDGAIVMFVAFGGGLTWASSLWRL